MIIQDNACEGKYEVYEIDGIASGSSVLSSSVTNGVNVGNGEVIFTGKTGNNLVFKTLVAGSNISLSSTTSTVIINADSETVEAGNGLTKTDNILNLGGELSEDVELIPSTDNVRAFRVGDDTNKLYNFEVKTTSGNIVVGDSNFGINADNITVEAGNAVVIDTPELILPSVPSGRTTHVLHYNDDDGIVTYASIQEDTGSNGITKTSGGYVLGGTLTGATTINQGSNALNLGSSSGSGTVAIRNGNGSISLLSNTVFNAINLTSNSQNGISLDRQENGTIRLRKGTTSTNTLREVVEVVRSTSGSTAIGAGSGILFDTGLSGSQGKGVLGYSLIRTTAPATGKFSFNCRSALTDNIVAEIGPTGSTFFTSNFRLPSLSAATTSHVIYYNIASGALTYGTATSGSTGLSVSAFNIYSASTLSSISSKFAITNFTGYSATTRTKLYGYDIATAPSVSVNGYSVRWNNSTSQWDFFRAASSASNGLSIGSGNIKFGGVLSENTAIHGGAYDLNIHAANLKLSGLTSASTSKVLYIDEATGLVSKGDAISSNAIVTEDVTGTTYTFVDTDAGKLKNFVHVSGCTATISSGLTSNWFVAVARASTAGVVSLSAGAGTTLNAQGTALNYPNTSASVIKTGSATYSAFGALTAAPILSKSVTIESPTSTEDISLFYTAQAITLSSIVEVVDGSSPSITYTIRYDSDRSSAGTSAVSRSVTSTTGNVVSNTTQIPAGRFIWLETTAKSGTVNWMQITINYSLT